MNEISVIESWKYGRETFKKNWLVLVYALIFPVIFSLLIDQFYHVNPMTYTNVSLSYLGPILIFYILKFLLDTMFKVGKIKIYLDALEGKRPFYKELFNPKKSYLNFLVISILIGLCTLGGLIFFVLPSVYIILRYCFAPILVIDQDMNIGEALTKSKEMTDGNKWRMLPYYAVYGFLVLLYMLGTGLVYLAIANPSIGLSSLPSILLVMVIVVTLLVISNLAILHLYRQLLVSSDKEENGGQMDFQDIQG
jgi:hypothetical protein